MELVISRNGKVLYSEAVDRIGKAVMAEFDKRYPAKPAKSSPAQTSRQFSFTRLFNSKDS